MRKLDKCQSVALVVSVECCPHTHATIVTTVIDPITIHHHTTTTSTRLRVSVIRTPECSVNIAQSGDNDTAAERRDQINKL